MEKQQLTVLTSVDRAKVQRCLDLLEAAQNLIESAAQQLCPVPGFADEWSALDKQCVKDQWYMVRNRLLEITT